MDSIKKALDAKDYESAALQASQALETNPNSAPLLLARSTALGRLGKNEQALKDAEKAVDVAGTAEQRADAQLRRGVALFQLDKPGEARTVFGYAKKTTQPTVLDIWLNKVASVPAVPVPETVPKASASASASASGGLEKNTAPRFDWYQAGPKATVCVYVRNAPKDADVQFESRKVSVKYDGLNFCLDLANEIDPKASSYDIGTPKIELSLAKKQPGQWSKLEAEKAPASTKPAAAFEKNWDIEDEEPGEESDPNAFLQQIYEKADPDARRAMMKSFVESNGTSLSTNWEDVKKGKVETLPPSGMVAKDWKS